MNTEIAPSETAETPPESSEGPSHRAELIRLFGLSLMVIGIGVCGRYHNEIWEEAPKFVDKVKQEIGITKTPDKAAPKAPAPTN